jgi:hypothetical protein
MADHARHENPASDKARKSRRTPKTGRFYDATKASVRVARLEAAIQRAAKAARLEGRTVQISLDVTPMGIVRVVSSPPRSEPVSRSSPGLTPLDASLARAHARGMTRLAEILSGPEMKSADDLARMLGTSRETVNQKRHRHELLGLEGPKRGVRFPDWQLTDEGGLLAGLPDIFEATGYHPWAVYRFLVATHPELDGATGVDALKGGRMAEAVALARDLRAGATT